MGDWVMIGVPSSAGAHHAGQERAPDALRAAGLAERLGAAGESVLDRGNLPGAKFVADRDHPGGRNLPAVVRVAREVADAVADAPAGRLPLVVGGDCTITLGVISGFRRRHPDVGLVYVDGDTDLGVPDSGGSGIFDSMGVSHLLGRGAPELAGLAGPVPLIGPARLAIVGADPRETDDAGRSYLADAGVSVQEALRSAPTRRQPLRGRCLPWPASTAATAPRRHSPGPRGRSGHLRAIGFSGRCSSKEITVTSPLDRQLQACHCRPEQNPRRESAWLKQSGLATPDAPPPRLPTGRSARPSPMGMPSATQREHNRLASIACMRQIE